MMLFPAQLKILCNQQDFFGCKNYFRDTCF